MALSVTVKETQSTSTNLLAGGTFLTDSFTPSNGSFLVYVLTGQAQNGAGVPIVDPSVSGGGLTWTKQGFQNYGTIASGAIVGIWTAPVSTGASMTATLTNNDGSRSFNNLSVVVYEVTGHNGNRTSSYSAALSPTPSASSVVLSGASLDRDVGDSLVAGTGWTVDFTVAGDGYMDCIHQRKVGATNAEYDTIDTGWSWAVAAIEIKSGLSERRMNIIIS